MIAPLLFAISLMSIGTGPRQTVSIRDLQALEMSSGGRLGVFALDTHSGKTLSYRKNERFLMCSTYKLFVVANILKNCDEGKEDLDSAISYSKADLVDYSPVTSAHVAKGSLPISTLCEAAMEVSDNTAANLLLARLGGPAKVTHFLRSLGDRTTRCDRNEPTVNDPHGNLDTTTPRAMSRTAQRILLSSELQPASLEKLDNWMKNCSSGLQRLRAGFPSDWISADKTGTGSGYVNDVVIVTPPGRQPIVIAAFYEAPNIEFDKRQAVLAQVGSIVAKWAASQN